MQTAPLVLERIYKAPVEAIWQALTDKDKMKQWYFDISSFTPEVGFEFEFTAGNEDRKFRHLCKITAVEENKKLSYTWRYDNAPGESLVTFELFPEGNNTLLRLMHGGIETFPQEDSDFKRESFTKGWSEILGKSLKEFLETQDKS